MFNRFLKNDSGAVTIDWVVMGAAVIGLGLAATGVVSSGVLGVGAGVASQMSGGTPQATFASARDIRDWRLASGAGTLSHAGGFGADGAPGYLVFTDANGGYAWLDLPASFEGNQASAWGGTLEWDLTVLIQSGAISTNTPPILQMTGTNGLRLTWSDPVLPVTGDWTHYSAPLASGAWHNGPHMATEADIRSVLADIEALELRVEYVDGNEQIGLDNVTLRDG